MADGKDKAASCCGGGHSHSHGAHHHDAHGHDAAMVGSAAVAIDPVNRTVQCATQGAYRYDDLVIGTGLEPDTEELAGIDAALATPSVASNYLNLAEKTWDLIEAMPARGRAVFTVPRPPVSCTGTTIRAPRTNAVVTVA